MMTIAILSSGKGEAKVGLYSRGRQHNQFFSYITILFRIPETSDWTVNCVLHKAKVIV